MDAKTHAIALGAGGVTVYKTTFTITAQDRARIDQEKLAIDIGGAIEYVDVFEGNRTTEFRFLWGGKFGTRDLTWADEGNKMY